MGSEEVDPRQYPKAKLRGHISSDIEDRNTTDSVSTSEIKSFGYEVLTAHLIFVFGDFV